MRFFCLLKWISCLAAFALIEGCTYDNHVTPEISLRRYRNVGKFFNKSLTFKASFPRGSSFAALWDKAYGAFLSEGYKVQDMERKESSGLGWIYSQWQEGGTHRYKVHVHLCCSSDGEGGTPPLRIQVFYDSKKGKICPPRLKAEPTEIQGLICKMASYGLKPGRDFCYIEPGASGTSIKD